MGSDLWAYVVFSCMGALFFVPMVLVLVQDHFDPHDLGQALLMLLLWAAVLAYVAGKRVSVRAGVCHVRWTYGIETRIPVARITKVMFKKPDYQGRRVMLRMDIAITYTDDAGESRELRINPKFYSLANIHRFLELLGYQGQKHQGRVEH